MTECDDDEEETKDGGGGGGKRKQVHTSSANSGGGGGDNVDGGDNDGEGPAYDLPVFTVSSMDYQKLAGVRDVTLDGPSRCFSAVNETEIPHLRRFVHRITLQARQKNIKRYVAREEEEEERNDDRRKKSSFDDLVIVVASECRNACFFDFNPG